MPDALHSYPDAPCFTTGDGQTIKIWNYLSKRDTQTFEAHMSNVPFTVSTEIYANAIAQSPVGWFVQRRQNPYCSRGEERMVSFDLVIPICREGRQVEY